MEKQLLFEAFDRALPADTLVDRRKMFGFPCAFVNGNMFAGVHQGDIVVRLDPQKQSELMAAPGAKPFVAMGRTMREYTCLPESMLEDAGAVAAWVDEAFRFAAALPVKPPKPRKKKGA